MKRVMLYSTALVLIATLAGCTDLVSGSSKETAEGALKAGGEDELVGVTWKLASMSGGKTGCEDITLFFKEDGAVEGIGGRNTYNGLYEIPSDGSLSIRGTAGARYLISTRVAVPACSKYTQYLFALAQAQSYSVEGKRLTIRGEDNVVLEFEAAK